MSAITTHVLDTSRGAPAVGVPVTLEFLGDTGWRVRGTGTTDTDGRVRTLLTPADDLSHGTWRLTFDTGAYFVALGSEGFYPEVVVSFTVRDGRHHHVPLLLNPFGYSTYRGS